MSTSIIDAALSEVNKAIIDIADPLEGLRDFVRLNLHDDSRAEVDESLVNYERREVLLVTAKAALDALVADGYPTLPVKEISLSALEDLQSNQRTVTAALAKFTSNAPVALSLRQGSIEPK